MAECRLIDLINSSVERLSKIDIDVPRSNVEMMLCSILNCRKVDLYLDPGRVASSDTVSRLDDMLSRRTAYEPLQYILGVTEFYGLKILCDGRALIPRPETEFVVSTAIEIGQDHDGLYIMDIGCGTGCIGVALAVNLPQATICAIDASEGAVELAKSNVYEHGLQSRFRLEAADWTALHPDNFNPFDLLVSNPPYVKTGELATLHRQIRDYEPYSALEGGEDGLDFIGSLISGAGRLLVPGGYLVFEIGQGQVKGVIELLEAADDLRFESSVKDYHGIDRVVVARKAVQPGQSTST
jgi:release factor glutamine methyltransferase